MFWQRRPQAAADDERRLLWGTLSETKAHFKNQDRELILLWESGFDEAGEPICIVYLEDEMYWDTPRGPERLGLGERQTVKEHIQEGAKVLGYEVYFVDAAPAVV